MNLAELAPRMVTLVQANVYELLYVVRMMRKKRHFDSHNNPLGHHGFVGFWALLCLSPIIVFRRKHGEFL